MRSIIASVLCFEWDRRLIFVFLLSNWELIRDFCLSEVFIGFKIIAFFCERTELLLMCEVVLISYSWILK